MASSRDGRERLWLGITVVVITWEVLRDWTPLCVINSANQA